MSQGQNRASKGLEVLQLTRIRAEFIKHIREFFTDRSFWEVDTPILIPYPLPEAHIDPVKAEGGYLHPSPEISMKPLLAYGCNKIYQIVRCFRAEEKGALHLQEFLMLEFYQLDRDYLDMMDLTEALIGYLAEVLLNSNKIFYGGNEIDLTPPWPRISFRDAFQRATGIAPEKAIQEDRFEEMIVNLLEPSLPNDRPCFLMDYPSEVASLAKLKDPSTAERFELYMAGVELANGFSELTDPIEQEQRFIKENQIRKRLGKTPFPIPKGFLSSLAKIPKAGGVAMGLDRLLAILTGIKDISQTHPITFNHLIP